MAHRRILLSPLPSEMIGLRLDKALSLLPEIASRSQAALLIEAAKVLVNQRKGKSSYLLEAPDVIEIQLGPPTESHLIPWNYPLEVLFEDNELLVVNKPAGMVVHPAAGHRQDTLVNALIFHTPHLSDGSTWDRPGLVHRIDKETSGLLVVAKNNYSHEFLAKQFKDRSIERKYWAVVEGPMKSQQTAMESYLARHPLHRKKFASVRDPKTKKIIMGPQAPSHGKWAKTHFKVLHSHGTFHYLELKLETGRTHQIRVHLSEMGLPIVGDELYGSKQKLNRFYLHAAELGFMHPVTKERLFFRTDWPKDDRALIQQWGLLNVHQ